MRSLQSSFPFAISIVHLFLFLVGLPCDFFCPSLCPARLCFAWFPCLQSHNAPKPSDLPLVHRITFSMMSRYIFITTVSLPCHRLLSHNIVIRFVPTVLPSVVSSSYRQYRLASMISSYYHWLNMSLLPHCHTSSFHQSFDVVRFHPLLVGCNKLPPVVPVLCLPCCLHIPKS